MRRNIIVASALAGFVTLLLWWALQPAPGVETKGGGHQVRDWVLLITAIVGLLTSVVTLVTTLIKGRGG